MTFSGKRKSVSSKTKPLCQGLSCQGSCRADARLRGWTKDAFRVSGITQVLLCTTSPTSSLRSMPPPLVGEALAFRDVFQQTSINLSKTKPLCQGLSCQESCRADARLRGWTKDAFRVSGITQVLLCTTSPTSSLRSMPPPLVGEALAFRDVFQQTQIKFHRKRNLFAKGSPTRGAVERMRD